MAITSSDNLSLKNFIFDAGVLISVITFASYLITFIYQLGICHTFKIPISYISISFSDIFPVAFTLLQSLALTFYISYLLKLIIINSKKPRYFLLSLRDNKFYLFLTIFYLFYVDAYPQKYYYATGHLLLFFVSSIVDKKKFKLLTKEEVLNFVNKKIVLNYISKLSFIYYTAALLLCYSTSTLNSENQEIFDVINSNPEKIILCKYDDIFITTQIENDSLKLYYKFYLIDQSTLSSNNLSIEKKYISKIKYGGIK